MNRIRIYDTDNKKRRCKPMSSPYPIKEGKDKQLYFDFGDEKKKKGGKTK